MQGAQSNIFTVNDKQIGRWVSGPHKGALYQQAKHRIQELLGASQSLHRSRGCTVLVQAKKGKSNSLSQGGANKRSISQPQPEEATSSSNGSAVHSNLSPAELAAKNAPRETASGNGSTNGSREPNHQEAAQASSRRESGESASSSGTYVQSSNSGTALVSSGIKLDKISKTFKDQPVLHEVSWDVKRGERVGLVGVNGSGKTTQLQIITGSLDADSGEILKQKANMRIAYLTQEFDVMASRTVREEFMSAFGDEVRTLRRQEQVQQELEQCTEDMDRMSELLDELNVLTNKASDLDISLLDKKVDQMMPELGFSQEDNHRLVASYSGGWQMRMCLGKILLQDPDLLLLDEPTNHLDLDAIEWLEGYLKRQEIPMVIVSHDREFLDQLCTKIVETERGRAETYKGNYTNYLAQKAERTIQQHSAYDKQQKEIARLEGLIAKLSAGAQSGRATAAEKQLEKMRADGLVEKPFVMKKRSFTFPDAERMGKMVLSIDSLTHGYQDRTLFKNAQLELEKGDRIAIIGPNGCGKSTLLRLITGAEKPISGKIHMGEHGILLNYYEQNQSEALDPNMTVTGTLVEASPDAKLNDIKALLGRMMFSGKAMEKKAGVLSGGEKARLALAKFMMRPGTFLVLDEPTNHLDIPSKEMLEEAITQFNGSLIAVSHDRYFLRKIATRIITVEGCKLKDYGGDYEVFMEENQEEAEIMAEKEEVKKEQAKKQIKAKSKTSKAEKAQLKRDKAKSFNQGASTKAAKAAKNNKRWN